MLCALPGTCARGKYGGLLGETFPNRAFTTMHTRQLSDEVLAVRVAQGDKRAFETLYDRHASMVLGITFRIIGKRQAAEEILQEIFWQMWQGSIMYQPEHGSFAGWLYRIARDRAMDRDREHTILPQAIPAETEEVDSIRESDIDAPAQARSSLKSQQMQDALKTLPREQRQVVELAYFHGMTRQEISDITGEPLTTIHTRARSGLQKLREELERVGVEF